MAETHMNPEQRQHEGGFVEINDAPVEQQRQHQPRRPQQTITQAAPIPPQPTPEPVPVAQIEEWPVTVRLLHKQVRSSGNQYLSELTFREPTGRDINLYGNPVRIDQSGDVIIDERKMTNIMAQLCGVLPPFLEQMDPRDWNSCAYRLRNFFLPEPEAWLPAEATPRT